MLTDNDHKFVLIVDEKTLVIDFRKNKASTSTQAGQARAIAVRHLFDDAKIFDRRGRNINVYHVESVAKKMWVVSANELNSDQTHQLVASLLG